MNTESTLLRTGLAVLVLGVSASAAVVSLNPIEDSFVSAANPNANYGSAGGLSAAAAALPKGEFNAVLKFDLAAAKASFDTTFGAGLWAIDGITLQFTATPPNNPLFNPNSAGQFSVKWMQNDTWTEGNGTPSGASTTGGIVFSTLPSFVSAADETLGTFSFSGASSGSSAVTLRLTTGFLADATAGNAVSLLTLPADNGVAYVFNSRSNGTVSNRPQLSVSASVLPEPGAATLLAGVALAALARRRNRVRQA